MIPVVNICNLYLCINNKFLFRKKSKIKKMYLYKI